jgi:hypothetical protein
MAHPRNRIYCIFILVFISLCGVSAFSASYEGTIVTRGGEKYEQVQFDVNSIYKVVIIKLDGEKRNISFDQIGAIYDLNGNDISSEVLKGYEAPSRETWISEKNPEFKRLNRRLWIVGFRFAGNFSIPSGDYFKAITSGIGLEGDFLVAVSREIAIKGTISKSGMKASKDYRYFSLDQNVEIPPEELHLNIMRYLLGVQYYARPPQLAAGKGLFYSYLSLGAISRRRAFFGPDDNLYYGESSDIQTRFLTSIGFGGTVLMSKHLGLDLSGEVDIVFLDPGDYGNVVRAYIIDFKIGLVCLY